MFKTLPLYIGLRYLLAKKDNRLISFTALISMAGLTLGVLVVIFVMSVFNGSQGVYRQRTLITVPHGDIYTEGVFSDWEQASNLLVLQNEIEAVSPYINTEAMLSHQGYHQVAEIKAIQPESEMLVSTIDQSIFVGGLMNLHAGEQGIILGRLLAANLRLNIGDRVNLILPKIGQNSQQFSLETHRFTVVGIFGVQFNADVNLAYVHIEDSLALLGINDVAERVHLRIKVNDIDRADEIVASGMALLAEELPQNKYLGEDWSISEASLFNALKLEKIMNWFMLMMIVIIGAFNIISTLVMVVSDKQADIAILRTMGVSKRAVMAIFMVQGVMVGISGTFLGAVFGMLLTLNFSSIAIFFENYLLPDNVYMISSLPAIMHIEDVVATCVCALVISFLATLYPAWKASRILPAEVLRYE